MRAATALSGFYEMADRVKGKVVAFDFSLAAVLLWLKPGTEPPRKLAYPTATAPPSLVR
jgi:hypothetical protein